MIIREAFENWLDVQSGSIRDISLKSYRGTIKNHLAAQLDFIEAEDYTPAIAGRHFSEWKKVKTESILLQMKKVLHAMFSYLVEEGVVERNPLRKIYVPQNLPDIEILTMQEVKIFLSELKKESYLYPHFLVLATAGLRVSELRGLKKADVDSKNDQIHIRRVYYYGREHEPKTKGSKRSVSLPHMVIEVLEEHILKCPDSPWLFPGRKGLPISHQVLGKAFHRWLERLELPSVTPHSLRHTHATFLLESGRSLKAIQKRMGWASANMLLRRYAHVTKEEEGKIVSDIENSFK